MFSSIGRCFLSLTLGLLLLGQLGCAPYTPAPTPPLSPACDGAERSDFRRWFFPRATPMFIGLGDFEGGDFRSAANSISAEGCTVVGVGAKPGESFFVPFRWRNGVGMQELGVEFGYAMDVSSDGTTVVGLGNLPENEGGYFDYAAFRWTDADGVQFLAGGSGSAAAALAVSADGSTVVGSLMSEMSGPTIVSSSLYGWNWGAMNFLPLGADTVESTAHDVSADGLAVVGTRSTGEEWEAFHWTKERGRLDLGSLEGGDHYSVAFGVSDDGRTVVGQSSSADGHQAFRWKFGEAQGMEGLGDLPTGDFHSLAAAASANGSRIVGKATTVRGSTAFIWDASNGMRNIGSLLRGRGVDLGGWRLTAASDISANGRVIVGQGINPGGHKEAWLAVIP